MFSDKQKDSLAIIAANHPIMQFWKVPALLARLEAAESSALDVPDLCKTFDYCEEMKSYSQKSLDALARHRTWLRASGKES